MSYPDLVLYFRGAEVTTPTDDETTEPTDWFPPSGYTLRVSSATDAAYVEEFNLLASGDRLVGGVAGQAPGTTGRSFLSVNLTGAAANWAGTIPQGTLLETGEGAEQVRGTVRQNWSPGDEYLDTHFWFFLVARDEAVYDYDADTPIRVRSAPQPTTPGTPDATPSPLAQYTAWVRIDDSAGVITDGFGTVLNEEGTITRSERARIFRTDALVAADWTEGDWIRSGGIWYQLQSRRQVSARELEFDATAHPQITLGAEPEGT